MNLVISAKAEWKNEQVMLVLRLKLLINNSIENNNVGFCELPLI